MLLNYYINEKVKLCYLAIRSDNLGQHYLIIHQNVDVISADHKRQAATSIFCSKTRGGSTGGREAVPNEKCAPSGPPLWPSLPRLSLK